MQDLKHITLRAQQRQQDLDDTAEWLAVTIAICILLLVWVFL